MLRRPGEYDEPQTKRLWTKIEARIWTVILFSGTSVLYASRVAFPISAAAIAKEYFWNKTDSGTVLSCFFWGYALTQLFAGWIADVYGGENVLPVSSLCWIILTFFTPQLFQFAYWSGYPLLVLLLIRIFTGVAQAFHIPSMASMVARHLSAGTDKGRVFGIILAGSHCGTVLAGSFGSLLLDQVGWRTMFHFIGVLSLLWYWCLHFVLTRSNYRQQISPSTSEADLLKKVKSDATSYSIPGITIASATVPWKALFQHPAFWAAAVAQYAGGNAYYTMFSWLPSYFHDTFPKAQGIVYNVVPNVSILITSILAPLVATRLLNSGRSMTTTRKLMEGISLLGVALCLFAVPYTASFTSALSLFTLAMACRGLHHGGVSVNPHDFAPHHTGAVFGIFNACGSITGFIGVYIAGHILDATNNNWSCVFAITGVQCIIGAVVYGLYGTGSKII